ncbi:MAG TPA: FkbM family methyltransferase [Polyangiaceae bacterium]|jgi:FkbM family methyltransferase|nr:FkbM family methyltransferase [Polyangiaceae bacterium]HPB96310.1 FkbM family methyltransferase [Polyangiaceae bacterium]HPY19927.1 FkbM family methyltransferase [Polyangiaceae bacterium]HQK20965.1 FkbM family methyltransferase [Polyangiaceae bacterium]
MKNLKRDASKMLRGAHNTFRFLWSHPIGRRNRPATLYRWAHWQTLSRIHDGDLLVPFVGNARLLVRRGMTGATGNIYCGLHEVEDMAFMMHLLQPDDLFVDIGANIGSYTILAAVACEARVESVEPIRATFDRLVDNIRLNRIEDRVRPHQIGVGDSIGELAFSTEFDTTNRVVDESFAGKVERVQVTTLDTLVGDQSPVFLKIDVEGHEDAVLAGAIQTLQKSQLLGVILEVNHAQPSTRDATKSLLSAGFTPYRYEPFGRTLEVSTPQSGNTLYLRNIDEVLERIAQAPRREIHGVQV